MPTHGDIVEELTRPDVNIERLIRLVELTNDGFNDKLLSMVIEKLVLASDRLLEWEFAELHSRLEASSDQFLALHWMRIGYNFVRERTPDNSRMMADSIIWQIENNPGLDALGQPYCYDLLDSDYERVSDRWNAVINGDSELVCDAFRNAAEFYREREPSIANELDLRAKKRAGKRDGSGEDA